MNISRKLSKSTSLLYIYTPLRTITKLTTNQGTRWRAIDGYNTSNTNNNTLGKVTGSEVRRTDHHHGSNSQLPVQPINNTFQSQTTNSDTNSQFSNVKESFINNTSNIKREKVKIENIHITKDIQRTTTISESIINTVSRNITQNTDTINININNIPTNNISDGSTGNYSVPVQGYKSVVTNAGNQSIPVVKYHNNLNNTNRNIRMLEANRSTHINRVGNRKMEKNRKKNNILTSHIKPASFGQSTLNTYLKRTKDHSIRNVTGNLNSGFNKNSSVIVGTAQRSKI